MYKLRIIILSSAVLFMFVFFSVAAYAASSTGTVECSGYLNIRQSPGTNYKIIGKIYPGTKITIEGISNGWYKIIYNGVNGWVSGEYVALDSSLEASSLKAAVPAGENSLTGQNIANYAQKFLGIRYIYGGDSPKGFDCSGFVQYVFKHFGIALERVADAQARQGTGIKKSELKPGDLLFFDTNGGHNGINHVGIYIGDGKFIHASSSRSHHRVTISEFDSFYAKSFMGARRLLD